jgi:ribosome-associated protein
MSRGSGALLSSPAPLFPGGSVDSIIVNDQVSVPAEAIRFRAVLAGGPGGQNVNKVASKVELRVELNLIEGLDEGSAARLVNAIRNQLDADGRWIVVSSATRDQGRNLDDARMKIRLAIEKALVVPKVRRATRPSKASKTRRLDAKKLTGDKKRERSGGWE